MTDVASVSLSSAGSLLVRQPEKGAADEKKIANGSLRVAVRQQPPESVYRVRVATTPELRRARKLSDELKKRFFEPVLTIFDDGQKDYTVLIGKFETRGDATGLMKRLRAAGYDDLRLVDKPIAASEAEADANPRAAKYKAQPSSAARAAKPVAAPQLVALSGNNTAVSSARALVVSAAVADNENAAARSKLTGSPSKSRDAKPPATAGSESAASQIVSVEGKPYRGEIHLLLNARGRINVVNSLPLEEYLRGVVPAELSPAHFPELEALKAQAVAARSFALARIGRNNELGFDLVDDTRDQVYGGLSVERQLTDRAVEETRGVVAVYPNDQKKLIPIEALYTANCGGRTENNEEVFGGTPLPYLRGVACAPDQRVFESRAITTKREVEAPAGFEGRPLAREIGTLSVLGFQLPRQVTSQYLRDAPNRDELRNWIEQLGRLSCGTPRLASGDFARLAGFARAIAESVYGGRAATLLAPADVDYLLDGLPVRDLPREARADVALLLRDGILNLSGGFDWRAAITRAQAIEVLARAIIYEPRTGNVKPRLLLTSETAECAQKGRLVIARSPASSDGATRAPGSRFTTVNTSRSSKNSQSSDPKGEDANANGLEIAEQAWLFRKLGGISYPVDRLVLVGGERVTYHLNNRGQIDLLEASISDRSAASDRFSNIAQWQERVPAEDLQRRLAGARINVGRVENVEPVAFSSSSRVTEVEITGDKGRARVRRQQIRSLFGLKEHLFVVDRETDAQGRAIAFVFTGRGWGHGVGLCQIGAYGLAKEGYSYRAILEKYYTGITLQKMY